MNRRQAVVGFAVGIALVSWGVSYSSQVQVALSHGFGAWQGGAWPACTEAAALAVMLLLVIGEIRPGLPTIGAWALVFACLATTAWVNWLAAPDDLVGSFMRSWTPVLSVAVFLLVVHGRPLPQVTRNMAVDAAPTPSEAVESELPRRATPQPKRPPRPVDKEAVILGYLESNRKRLDDPAQRAAVIREAKEKSGASLQHTRRVARNWRSSRPHLIAAEEA